MSLPLADIKVCDLTQNLAGPYCSQILADLGADVVKVEPPGGDLARAWGPPFWGSGSALSLSVNRGKRSIVLDLKTASGKDVLRRIAEMATENQLVVRSFKRERAVSGAHYTEMPLATVIEGRFAGIHQFLHDLESMPRITRILNMSIEKPLQKSRSDMNLAQNHVRAQMTISIYADPSKGADAR